MVGFRKIIVAININNCRLVPNIDIKILYIRFQRENLGPIRSDVNSCYDLSSHDLSIILYIFKKYMSPKNQEIQGHEKGSTNLFSRIFIKSNTL